MRPAFAVFAFATGMALGQAACGGNVEQPEPRATGGLAGANGSGGHGGKASGRGGSGAGGGAGAELDAGFDPYPDPGCPDAALPPPLNECDAFAVASGCPDGQGCYPFVDHPAGTGCGAQTFGTICAPAGTGVQGDSCGSGRIDCASGFVCVIGAVPGKHCVELCHLDGSDACPHGLICGVLDVDGYGVCS
jgi:hypothetical protein